ncbi:MAG: chorismate mutase [Gemmatimonadaceae bacterium]|nr:chorismate mutase [Gemmatimonadaceae bacterium]
MEKRLCGLRGATTVDADSPDLIADATRELLSELIRLNGLEPDDVISAIFTVTPDLTSEFPARAARGIGWDDTSLLCTVEIPVPGALSRCIRVLIHANSARERTALRHAYLRAARSLRPDIVTD